MVTNFLIRKMYLLPLEGVRGEEPSLGEGLGRFTSDKTPAS
jgi:hypothetical protein